MDLKHLPEYVNTICEDKSISPIPLFLGLEVDYFSQKILNKGSSTQPRNDYGIELLAKVSNNVIKG